MLDFSYEGERSNMSKTRDETRHSTFRAKQRYFLSLSKEDILSIVTLIQLNLPETTEFVCSESNRISIWKVLYQEKWLVVVYDKKRHTLATVLPPTVTEEYLLRKNKDNFFVPGEDRPRIHKNDLTLGGFVPEHWTK